MFILFMFFFEKRQKSKIFWLFSFIEKDSKSALLRCMRLKS